ncbi:MAG: trigger factor [Thermodesulfobacteriota bacterium]
MLRIDVEDLGSTKKRLQIEVPGEIVTKEIDSAYRKLSRKAKVKGFRPGKVPRPILQRYYGDYIKNEVISKLINDTYFKAISDKDIKPVSQPTIDNDTLEEGRAFEYSAIVEVRPDIQVKDYLNLYLKASTAEVAREDVEKRLRELQNLHAQLVTVERRKKIREGDFVIIDYEGFSDGRPFEGSSGKDFMVQVGSGEFIPGFDEKIIGAERDDEVEVEMTYRENHPAMAGRRAVFRVRIKEIKEKILPKLDDEFAKDIGEYKDLKELKARISEDLKKEGEESKRRELENQLIEKLIAGNPFDVPRSMVEQQIDYLVADAKIRLASQGLALKDVGVGEGKLRKDFEEAAVKRVKQGLILEKISALEGISVKNEEVTEKLREISLRTNQNVEKVRGYYQKGDRMEELKARIVEEKTLDFLLKRSNISVN